MSQHDTKKQSYSSKIDSLLATGHWPHLKGKESLGMDPNRINDRTRTIWPSSSLKTMHFPFFSGTTLVSYHNIMNYSYKKNEMTVYYLSWLDFKSSLGI